MGETRRKGRKQRKQEWKAGTSRREGGQEWRRRKKDGEATWGRDGGTRSIEVLI